MSTVDYSPQQNHYQALIAQRTIKYELARRRLLDFCQLTKPDFITAPHHRLLCEVADRLIAGTLKRVILCIPPRHGKSEIYSIRLPAMYLGLHPEAKLIHISYAAALSNTFSMQVRALVRDDEIYHELFPDVQLDPDRQPLNDWHTTAGGGFKSVGAGGGLSGHGGDGIIIDDIMQEGDENSPTILRQKDEWYTSAARTRLSPQGWIAIINTRWALGDLVGFVLDNAAANPDGDQWEVIVLPALALENDPLGRDVGEALWPERFSVSDLLALKSLSAKYFQSLYQQDPQPEGAKLFFTDWFTRRLYESISEPAIWAFDLAIGEDETADFSVFGRWHFDRDLRRLYVSCLHREQQLWTTTKEQIKALMQQYPRDKFVFPKHTYELMAVQELKALGADYANQIEQVSLSGDKRERAATYHDVAANGGAFVEAGAVGDWFIREHDRFPDEHDDCVDMSSVAAHYYLGTAAFDFLVRGREKETENVQLAS